MYMSTYIYIYIYTITIITINNISTVLIISCCEAGLQLDGADFLA